MSNNNNKEVSPGSVIGAIAFFVLSFVYMNAFDSIILSMILSALTMGVAVVAYLAIKEVWARVDRKKAKKYLIIIVSSLLGLFVVLGIINACFPVLTEENIEKLLLEQLEEQINEVKEDLGVSDLTVEFELEDFKFKKRTLFSGGYVNFTANEYYISSEFTELENEEYNETTREKYAFIGGLDYDDIIISGYAVNVYGYGSAYIKDSKGNRYDIDFDEIKKNGRTVYKKEVKRSSSTSSYKSTSRCDYCGGSGKCVVTWYSHGDWGETSYSSYTCTRCNGTGRG